MARVPPSATVAPPPGAPSLHLARPTEGAIDILDVTEAIVHAAASALALGAEVILVTGDRDLAKAGRALGFDLAGALDG